MPETRDITAQESIRGIRAETDFGRWIREQRRRAGLTQMQLAVQAGVSVGVVRDLEQGIRPAPSAASGQRLLKALERQAALPQLGRFPSGSAGLVHHSQSGMPSSNQLLLLGQLEFRRNGEPVPLGSPRQQAVLALLALNAEAPVSRESFLESLWGSRPPPTAVAMIQSSVSRLRKVLSCGTDERGDAVRIIRVGAGYALQIRSGQLDSAMFAAMCVQARTLAATDEPVRACRSYEEALSLWRGEPLAGLDLLRDHPGKLALSRQWAAAITEHAALAIKLARHDRALMHLPALTDREQLNERAHACLMLALAGTGHQALAIDVFERIRRRLADQLGLSPSAELREAHARVLRQEIGMSDYKIDD